MTDENPDDGEQQKSEEHPAGVLEKIATTVSAILVVFLLAVLLVDAIRPNAEPAFVTHTGQLRESSGAFRVPITVENTGDDAARAVVVHAELRAADSVLAHLVKLHEEQRAFVGDDGWRLS